MRSIQKTKKKRPKTWHPLYKTPTKLTACTKNIPKHPATFARLGFGGCLCLFFFSPQKKHQLHQNRGAQNRASQLQSPESSTFQNLSGRDLGLSGLPRRPHHSVPMYSHGIQRFFRVRSTSGKELGQQNVLVGFFASPKRRNRRWDEPLQFSRWRPRFLWVGSQVAKAKTSSFQ